MLDITRQFYNAQYSHPKLNRQSLTQLTLHFDGLLQRAAPALGSILSWPAITSVGDTVINAEECQGVCAERIPA